MALGFSARHATSRFGYTPRHKQETCKSSQHTAQAQGPSAQGEAAGSTLSPCVTAVPHLDGLGELHCFKWSFESAVQLWEAMAHLYYHAARPGLAPHLLLHIRQLTQTSVTLGQQRLAQAERGERGGDHRERDTR